MLFCVYFGQLVDAEKFSCREGFVLVTKPNFLLLNLKA